MTGNKLRLPIYFKTLLLRTSTKQAPHTKGLADNQQVADPIPIRVQAVTQLRGELGLVSVYRFHNNS